MGKPIEGPYHGRPRGRGTGARWAFGGVRCNYDYDKINFDLVFDYDL